MRVRSCVGVLACWRVRGAAFFIMGIVLCLYAIIGVTFYDARSPDDFGNLSRAIISMFRIAAGETWFVTCIYRGLEWFVTWPCVLLSLNL